MSDTRTGGDNLVAVLRRHEVDVVFGVVSVHNLPLVHAVDQHLKFVPVRSEAAAVSAADGYGRARDHFGVALTSTGTGAGNAAGSLIEALSAGSRVLHITGQIPSDDLGLGKGVIHETEDQLGMLRAVSRMAATITTPDDAESVLEEAVFAMRSIPSGPSSVEWPIDLQYFRGRTSRPRSVSEPATQATAQELLEARSLLATSRRPIIWAGGGARGARAQVDRLASLTGAGVLTSNSGRGTIPEDDPRCIGNFATSPACAPLLQGSDLLISVGTHFRGIETRDFTLAFPTRHIQIDADPSAIGRSYKPTVGLVGDAARIIDNLLDQLDSPIEVDPAWSTRVLDTRASVREKIRNDLGRHAVLCDALRAVSPQDSTFARDVTIASSMWGNRLLEIYSPETNIFPRGGGIGQGLAMGVGASIALPTVPTVVMIGDGGLTAQLGELLTATHEGSWLVILLFNDNGYGVLRNMQDLHLGRRSGVDLPSPDFSLLSRSVDLPYFKVVDVTDFPDVLSDALGLRRPTLVEVDLEALPPMNRPFTPPVRVPTESF